MNDEKLDERSRNIKGMHVKLVSGLTSPRDDDEAIRSEHLIHMVVGISDESGDLLEAIKNHAIHHQPLHLLNVVEELGDIEFYLEGLRQELKIDRDLVLSMNNEKLNKRYEDLCNGHIGLLKVK